PPGPGRYWPPRAPTCTRPSSPGPPGPATFPGRCTRWARPAWPSRPTPARSQPAAPRGPPPSPAPSTPPPPTPPAPPQDALGPGLVSKAAWPMLQGQAPPVDGDGRQEPDFLCVDGAVDAVAR